MRVSESLRYANLRSQLGSMHSKLEASTREIASGLRVHDASDSPAGAATAQRIDAALRSQEAYTRVADRMEGQLEASDAALDSATSVLVSARELASQFGSGAWNDAAWQAPRRRSRSSSRCSATRRTPRTRAPTSSAAPRTTRRPSTPTATTRAPPSRAAWTCSATSPSRLSAATRPSAARTTRSPR